VFSSPVVADVTEATEPVNLPLVYKLPAFTAQLVDKLEKKCSPTPELRRQIVNALYEDVAKLTL